jgi:hypothetical protein
MQPPADRLTRHPPTAAAAAAAGYGRARRRRVSAPHWAAGELRPAATPTPKPAARTFSALATPAPKPAARPFPSQPWSEPLRACVRVSPGAAPGCISGASRGMPGTGHARRAAAAARPDERGGPGGRLGRRGGLRPLCGAHRPDGPAPPAGLRRRPHPPGQGGGGGDGGGRGRRRRRRRRRRVGGAGATARAAGRERLPVRCDGPHGLPPHCAGQPQAEAAVERTGGASGPGGGRDQQGWSVPARPPRPRSRRRPEGGERLRRRLVVAGRPAGLQSLWAASPSRPVLP